MKYLNIAIRGIAKAETIPAIPCWTGQAVRGAINKMCYSGADMILITWLQIDRRSNGQKA